MGTTNTDIDIQKLRDILLQRFSLEDLSDLCFRLGVSWDDLPGETLSAKSREFILYMARRDRLGDLVASIKKQRPDIGFDWPDTETIEITKEAQTRIRPVLGLSLVSRERPYGEQIDFGLMISNIGTEVADQITPSVAVDNHGLVLRADPLIDRLAPGAKAMWRCVLRPLHGGRIPLKVTVSYQQSAAHPKYTAMIEDVLRTFEPTQRYPYTPLERNPYITGSPVQTDAVFFGRDKLIADIAGDLQGLHQDNLIFLYGQRRTGKTSILYALRRHLPKDRYVSVIFDAQGATSPLSLFWGLAMNIRDACAESGVVVPEPKREDFVVEPNSQFEHGFLRLVRQSLGARRLLLMVDEFESLEEAVQSRGLPDSIFPYLRHLMQHEQIISFIFCGAHQIRELTTRYWQIFFNSALTKFVSFLDREATRNLIRKPVESHFVYDELALDRLSRLSGGNPYFTQLLCHSLVKLAADRECGYVTCREVDEVTRNLVQTGNDHLEYLWQQSSWEERAVLLAITGQVAPQQWTETRWQQVMDRLRELCPSACASADEARDSLKQRELIAGDAWGVRFTMGIIPEWLVTHRSWASLERG